MADKHTTEKLLEGDRLSGKVTLFAKVTILPGDELSYHEHHGETEVYHILSGEGLYQDNDKTYPVEAEMTTFCEDGNGHAISCKGDEPLVANPVNQVGYAMHDRPGIEFFRQASLVMQKAENKEACEAYIYGFCCHFALDVSCHGYIDEKIAESGVSHTEIEVEFDRKLMLTDGFNPLTHNLTVHIHPTLKNAEVISPFYKNVTPQQAEQALQGMITNNKLLIAPSYFKRFLIYGLLKATGNYKEMHGLLVNYSENPQCTDSTQMLMQLYLYAEKLSELLIY